MKRDISLLNRTVIVTGSSRGIGAEIAKSFGKTGAKVALCFNTEKENAEKIKKQISKYSETEVFQCDISKPKNIKTTINEIVTIFKKVDILVNNAGVLKQTDFRKISEEEYDWIMDTNLKGAFFLSQAAIPYLIKT